MIPVAILLGLALFVVAYLLFVPPTKQLKVATKPSKPKSPATLPPRAGAPSEPPSEPDAKAIPLSRKKNRSSAPPKPPAPAKSLPYDLLPNMSDDEEDDITVVTLRPSLAGGEDDADDTTLRVEGGTVPILYDDEAAYDEPTHPGAIILVSAVAQTDAGLRRKKNEDSFLVLDEASLFVVADGMGGHAGGEVASGMAVDVIAEAFKTSTFVGKAEPGIPRRGAETAMAVQMANHAIWEASKKNREHEGMGTTIVAARFSPKKQRLYVAHVGDSRCYRFRGVELRQMTTDHTMAEHGLSGPLADRLSRAAGVGAAVKIDLILARPIPNDVYLLCSDGLSKMVPLDEMRALIAREPDLDVAVRALVDLANEKGGRDNITAILVRVSPAISRS